MNAEIDADERSLELPSMIQPRIERILWLGLRIASVSLIVMLLNIAHTLQAAQWIRYDEGAQCFVPTDCVNINLATNAKVRPQATDQDIGMLDDATSESDVDVAQYTPPESKLLSCDFTSPPTIISPHQSMVERGSWRKRSNRLLAVRHIGRQPNLNARCITFTRITATRRRSGLVGEEELPMMVNSKLGPCKQ